MILAAGSRSDQIFLLMFGTFISALSFIFLAYLLYIKINYIRPIRINKNSLKTQIIINGLIWIILFVCIFIINTRIASEINGINTRLLESAFWNQIICQWLFAVLSGTLFLFIYFLKKSLEESSNNIDKESDVK